MIGLSDQKAPFITPLKKTYTIGGEDIHFESGKLGLLADGAITISDERGNLMLTTAGFKQNNLNTEADFFPLSVDYLEKYYATGKVGGSRFRKREGRPGDDEVLKSRLIDRPIRPMFPKGLINETQIMAQVLSSDNESHIGFYGIISASLALMVAGTPFEGPVAGVRISLLNDGSYIFHPTFEQESQAKLTLLVAGTSDAITMVESQGQEISQSEMMDALKYAFSLIQELCQAQTDFVSLYKDAFGIPNLQGTYNIPDESLFTQVQAFLTSDKLDTFYGLGKLDFHAQLTKLEDETKTHFGIVEGEESEINPKDIESLVYKCVKNYMRDNVLQNKKRLDLRALDEVRPLKCEVGILPRAHGSALFQRGMTQVLSVTSLSGPDDKLLIDGMYDEKEERYFHHYNFPPYSVGEVQRLRGVGRREVGHGRLAQKALEPVLPSEAEFPYTMRVVSETMTCNGSSSMASVCGSTLALMHAGVPITAPVGGVAMGMIYDEASGNYEILTDIQAQEDFLGDMDFKVTMTPNGITAMQLDVKIAGLSFEVFEKAFTQARAGIDTILDAMLKVQPTHSQTLSPYAPLIMNIFIPVDKIRAVIGKGGENIQGIENEHQVSISIADDGNTTITAKDQVGGNAAIEKIKSMIWEPEVGYKGVGKIAKIIDGVGAIVEFQGSSGMIHISKLAPIRVEKVENIVKLGEEVEFEVIQIDKEKGRIGLKKVFEEVKKEETIKKEEK